MWKLWSRYGVFGRYHKSYYLWIARCPNSCPNKMLLRSTWRVNLHAFLLSGRILDSQRSMSSCFLLHIEYKMMKCRGLCYASRYSPLLMASTHLRLMIGGEFG